jgi:hypothetical protein
MTTEDTLNDLTTDIGDALRETWLKGYDTASTEILGTVINELQTRLDGVEASNGNSGIVQGLTIAIAIVKGLLK